MTGARAASFIICAAAMVAAKPLQGQQELTLSVVAGPSQYDLSGTGTAPFISARLDVVPVRARAIVLEANLEYFTYHPQFGARVHHWFPEASVQLQIPARVVRPYLGAGAGYSLGGFRHGLTLHGTGGLRISMANGWGIRGELRVRSVNPWTGVTADWGLGISRQLD